MTGRSGDDSLPRFCKGGAPKAGGMPTPTKLINLSQADLIRLGSMGQSYIYKTFKTLRFDNYIGEHHDTNQQPPYSPSYTLPTESYEHCRLSTGTHIEHSCLGTPVKPHNYSPLWSSNTKDNYSIISASGGNCR